MPFATRRGWSLTIAAMALAMVAPAQINSQPASLSGHFSIFKLQHHIGAETWTRVGDTLTTNWLFTYIGSTVKLTDSLTVASDGRPLEFHAHGGTSTLTDVNLDVTVGDRAGFPLHMYPPAAIEEALFARWVKLGKPAAIPLLPAGEVRFERRGADELKTGGTVDRYSVDGVLWGRQSLWVDTANHVIATASGDAELDRMEEIREGFEGNLPTFVASGVKDGLDDLARAARTAPPVREGAFAIVGGRLIDGTGAPPIDDAVVIVRDGQIEAAGPAASVSIPRGMAREDATGKTIIPGLWDMHVHFEQVEWPMAQLAAGVTTARDCGNELELATGLRDAIAAGRVPGPRMLLAGLIDGAPDGLGAFVAATPDEARRIVHRYHDAGYVQMKIYGSLPPALVPIVAAEAHQLGMTVTGHVPRGMNAREFLEAGADQINHIGYVLALFQGPAPQGQPRPPLDLTTDAARETMEFLKAHHLVLDPTLARSEQGAHPKDVPFAKYEPGAAHAPPQLLEALNASGTSPAASPNRLLGLERLSALIPALVHAGVPVVAGTDLVVPGHSIARELELYVRAGLTPMEALQAATIVPARVMGHEADSGTVTAGKRADLVILDADPLASIGAVRQVHLVIAAGRAFAPAPLWQTAGFAAPSSR
jgi:imidazolonepropionase-like amidohydrolase